MWSSPGGRAPTKTELGTAAAKHQNPKERHRCDRQGRGTASRSVCPSSQDPLTALRAPVPLPEGIGKTYKFDEEIIPALKTYPQVHTAIIDGSSDKLVKFSLLDILSDVPKPQSAAAASGERSARWTGPPTDQRRVRSGRAGAR